MQALQEVHHILAGRGIEVTPEQIQEWAEKMVSDYMRISKKESKPEHWLQGVVRGHKIPTMCLHLHFGDSK